MSFIRCLSLILSFVLLSFGLINKAQAYSNEVTLGASAAISRPLSSSISFLVGLGLNDYFSAEARLGGQVDTKNSAGLAALGLVASLDVLTWVPELRLALGTTLNAKKTQAYALASLGVRRYLSLRWALAVAVGTEWLKQELKPTAGVYLWYGFP